MNPDSNIGDLTILAVDHGARRIGVAIRPAGTTLVLPLPLIAKGTEAANIIELREVIRSRGARLVVVGLPVNPDPAQAREVKRFTRDLREGITGVRFTFFDETLTSSAAHELHREAGVRGPRAGQDSTAAALILESFLASARHNSM